MPEFEGSLVDERGEAEAVRDDIVAPDPDISPGTTRDEIELEEFPSRRQSAERTLGRPSVSLVHMRKGLADQTEFSRGVIWSIHITIEIDCFLVPVFYLLKNPGIPCRYLLRNYFVYLGWVSSCLIWCCISLH